MNFLQLLASGASILNFNFQSKGAQSLETLPKTAQKTEGFQKVDNHHVELEFMTQIATQIPNDQATILNQILQNERQELINRYLQLNLQLFQGKIANQTNLQKKPENQNQNDQFFSRDENQQSQKHLNSKKKIKKAVKCGHEDKAHYAKGLCNNCYHKHGRTKKPWNCPHEKLYAGGMCQNCYINSYNKKKRQQNVIHEQKIQTFDHNRDKSIILSEQKGEEKKETSESTHEPKPQTL